MKPRRPSNPRAWYFPAPAFVAAIANLRWQVFESEWSDLLLSVKQALVALRTKKGSASLSEMARNIYDLIDKNMLSTDGVAVLTDLPYYQYSTTEHIMDTLKGTELSVGVSSLSALC